MNKKPVILILLLFLVSFAYADEKIKSSQSLEPGKVWINGVLIPFSGGPLLSVSAVPPCPNTVASSNDCGPLRQTFCNACNNLCVWVTISEASYCCPKTMIGNSEGKCVCPEGKILSNGNCVEPINCIGMDYNENGDINIRDSLSLLSLLRDNPNNPRADYNGDGTNSITDSVALLLDISRYGSSCKWYDQDLLMISLLNQDAKENICDTITDAKTKNACNLIDIANDLINGVITVDEAKAKCNAKFSDSSNKQICLDRVDAFTK